MMKNKVGAVFSLFVFLNLTTGDSASATELNLENVVQRWNQVSYDDKIAEKNVAIGGENLINAGKWANPSIEISAGNRIGLDSGDGGLDPTQLRVNQAIPIFRTRHQKAMFSETLKGEKSRRKLLQLKKEYDISVEFHELQFQKAKFVIAEEKLASIRRALGRKKKDSLVRFLKPIDKSRLKIEENDAFVAVENNKGELEEAIENIITHLQLSRTEEINIKSLSRITKFPSLNKFKDIQTKHPYLNELNHKQKSFEHKISLEKSKRFNDPVISLYSEKDYLNNRKQNAYGLSLMFSIPLWNTNSTEISKAKFNVDKYEFLKSREKLHLDANLYKSYQHLLHLNELEMNYRTKVIPSSKKFLNLTVKGFSVGESNVLSLVDAYDNYYNTQQKYHEVLKNSWKELAAVRYFASQKLSNAEGGK